MLVFAWHKHQHFEKRDVNNPQKLIIILKILSKKKNIFFIKHSFFFNYFCIFWK